MKIKFTNKQIAGILNESSEDYIVKAIKLLGGIHSDNIASVDMIKGILEGGPFLTFEEDFDLNNLKLKDRIRFHEYWNRFKGTTDGRGFAFEGLIAGLFGGETTAKLNYEDSANNKKNPTQDVIIEGYHYSLKFSKDNKERYHLGSYKSKIKEFYQYWYGKDNVITELGKTTVMSFLIDGDDKLLEKINESSENKIDYEEMKTMFLETCFDSKIIFLFAYLKEDDRTIEYDLCPVSGVGGVIHRLMNGELMSGKTKHNSIGLSQLKGQKFKIIFPNVSKEEVDEYLPVDGGERDIDQVYDIFNDEVKKYLRPEVLAYIYSNKDEISNKLNSLNESDSFMNRRVDKVTFRKIVNPRVTLTVEKHPNGEIVSIDNPYKVRFPFQKGQVLNRGYETWAHTSGYEFSIDGRNFKGKPEKKKFGIPVSLLPPHLKNL